MTSNEPMSKKNAGPASNIMSVEQRVEDLLTKIRPFVIPTVVALGVIVCALVIFAVIDSNKKNHIAKAYFELNKVLTEIGDSRGGQSAKEKPKEEHKKDFTVRR